MDDGAPQPTRHSDGRALAEPPDFSTMLAEAERRARGTGTSGRRRMIGVTGPPGAGKSTLCGALVERLGPIAALVAMDGFHLANAELIRLGRRDRKGAPDTFDVDGYVALLARLRSRPNETVYAPRFARDIEEAIAGSVPVAPDVEVVVTEGNYLLLDSPAWQRVRPELDEVWFLEVAEEVRVERLVHRHRYFGKSAAAAREWTERVDLGNAQLIAEGRDRADLIIRAPDDHSSPNAPS